MTVTEMRQYLTMLWSLYPNAPKLSTADKTAMVIAWYSLFWQYSFRDAWNAARVVMKRKPQYLPTAAEIANVAFEDYDIYKFLPHNWAEIRDEIPNSEYERLMKAAGEAASHEYFQTEMNKIKADADSVAIMRQSGIFPLKIGENELC